MDTPLIEPARRGPSRPPAATVASLAVATLVVATLVVVSLVAGPSRLPSSSPPAAPATTSEPSLQETLTLVGASTLPAWRYERQVQAQVNKRRAARGLRRLRLVSCADRAAERWSRHLAETGRFYHQSMDSLLDRCNAVYAGETLGRGTMSPRKLVRMWMRSPSHRRIVLSRSPRRLGVGAVRDGSGRWVVTVDYVRL